MRRNSGQEVKEVENDLASRIRVDTDGNKRGKGIPGKLRVCYS